MGFQLILVAIDLLFLFAHFAGCSPKKEPKKRRPNSTGPLASHNELSAGWGNFDPQ